MNIAIVCCNLPTLRPLLSRFSSQFSSYGPISRNTGNQTPGTTGLANSRRQTLRVSGMPIARQDHEGGVPLKNIMVTTEIKQDYQEHDHKKHSNTASLDESSSSIKGDDFV